MTKPESLSKRAELRFWGWGYADEHLSLEEDQLVEAMVAVMAPNSTEVAPPSLMTLIYLRLVLPCPKRFLALFQPQNMID